MLPTSKGLEGARLRSVRCHTSKATDPPQTRSVFQVVSAEADTSSFECVCQLEPPTPTSQLPQSVRSRSGVDTQLNVL